MGTGSTMPSSPPSTEMDVYFDFTCAYSRRTGRWWRELAEPARWRPFLLREAHRADDGPAEWQRDDALERVSVLALALHEAVDAAGGDVAAYRWQTMELFERGRVDAQQLRRVAAGVGGRDLDDQSVGHGLRAVGQSHQHALSLQVFGTPTFVGERGSAYLKLAEEPTRARARAVHDAVLAVVNDTPEVAEIKRPS